MTQKKRFSEFKKKFMKCVCMSKEILNDDDIKRTIIELLEILVEKTDNEVDDILVKILKEKLKIE